jgi:hypothetical protein
MGAPYPHGYLVFWLILSIAASKAAGQCVDVAYTACPSAAAMAQALVPANSQMTVSNAVYIGGCNSTVAGAVAISSFGNCHYLSSMFPNGETMVSYQHDLPSRCSRIVSHHGCARPSEGIPWLLVQALLCSGHSSLHIYCICNTCTALQVTDPPPPLLGCRL